MLVKFLLFLVKFYQVAISSFTPPSCRFSPTCSEYAIQSIKIHGALYGVFFTTKRILRCNPFGGSGFDPVPEKKTPKKQLTKTISS